MISEMTFCFIFNLRKEENRQKTRPSLYSRREKDQRISKEWRLKVIKPLCPDSCPNIRDSKKIPISNQSLIFGDGGVFAEPSVHTQPDDTKESFSEDAAGHFRHTFTAIDEDDRHFLDLKTDFVGSIFHFNLKGISLETDLVERNGLKYSAAVTLETGCGVVDIESCDETDILGGEITHQNSADRPVDHVDPADISGTDSHIISLIVACSIQTW